MRPVVLGQVHASAGGTWPCLDEERDPKPSHARSAGTTSAVPPSRPTSVIRTRVRCTGRLAARLCSGAIVTDPACSKSTIAAREKPSASKSASLAQVLGLRRREPGLHHVEDDRACKAVRQHKCLGAPSLARGKQLKQSALVDTHRGPLRTGAAPNRILSQAEKCLEQDEAPHCTLAPCRPGTTAWPHRASARMHRGFGSDRFDGRLRRHPTPPATPTPAAPHP
jgi:hypothetical protein